MPRLLLFSMLGNYLITILPGEEILNVFVGITFGDICKEESTVEETRIRIEILIYQYCFSKLTAIVTPLSVIVIKRC